MIASRTCGRWLNTRIFVVCALICGGPPRSDGFGRPGRTVRCYPAGHPVSARVPTGVFAPPAAPSGLTDCDVGNPDGTASDPTGRADYLQAIMRRVTTAAPSISQ